MKVSSLEMALKSNFPNYGSIVTARGSTALYLALTAIKKTKGGGEVILPSTVCPSVPFTVALTGLTPRFSDVEADSFCLSAKAIQPLLSDKTLAIIAVYLFGKSLDIEGIVSLAAPAKIAVIEDVAQAIGGLKNGSWLGGFGDFTLLSFAKTKILKGSGGGLLVRDPAFLTSIADIWEEMPEKPEEEEFIEMERGFRDLTMGYFDLMRSEELKEVIPIPPSVIEKFRRLFIHRSQLIPSEINEESRQLQGLEGERVERFAKVQTYLKYLDPQIQTIPFSEQEICWRLPILVGSHAH